MEKVIKEKAIAATQENYSCINCKQRPYCMYGIGEKHPSDFHDSNCCGCAGDFCEGYKTALVDIYDNQRLKK